MAIYYKDIIYLVRNKVRDEGYKVLQDDNYLLQLIASNIREIMTQTLDFRKKIELDPNPENEYSLPEDLVSVISVYRKTSGKMVRYIHTTIDNIENTRNLGNLAVQSSTHYWAFSGNNKIIIEPNISTGEKLVINYFYALGYDVNLTIETMLPENFPNVLINAVVSKTAYDLYNEGKVNYNLLPPGISEVWYYDYQTFLTNYIISSRTGKSILEHYSNQNTNPYV